jgi:hypothetical protein
MVGRYLRMAKWWKGQPTSVICPQLAIEVGRGHFFYISYQN